MTRSIGASNLAEINSPHIHEVTLVKLEFDTPVYVHSGIGDIIYDTNTYLGVGSLGNVSEARESQVLGPDPITLSLDGTDSALIAEALDSGNYGDLVTVYAGYRQDDGTLVEDPFIIWAGFFDYATAVTGSDNTVNYICQHDLSVLNEKQGARLSDEDQENKFTGDLGLEFVADMAYVKLAWGRHTIGGGGGRGDSGRDRPREFLR